MQRTIKFRAWDKRNKKMLYDGIILAMSDCSRHSTYYGYKGRIPDLIDLMQFTGLHDRNGKEIWEGDRLKYLPTGVVYEVEWDATDVRFSVCAQNDDFLMALGDCDLADAEVIGHIYESPEYTKSV